MESLSSSTNELEMDDDFRLWLSTKPDDRIPVPILQASHKVAIEEPAGLKAQLLKVNITMSNSRKSVTRSAVPSASLVSLKLNLMLVWQFYRFFICWVSYLDVFRGLENFIFFYRFPIVNCVIVEMVKLAIFCIIMYNKINMLKIKFHLGLLQRTCTKYGYFGCCYAGCYAGC